MQDDKSEENLGEGTMKDNEGIRVRDARNCLLCANEGILLYKDLRDPLFSAPGIWALMQCPKCQLFWLNPQPIPEDIGKLYSTYFTHHKPNSDPKLIMGGFRKFARESILQYSYNYKIGGSSNLIGLIFSRIGFLKEIAGSSVRWIEGKEKGRLLDVGCGDGSFLNRMKQLGWDVMGVEPDEKAVSVAREKFGLEVFHGSLEEAKFSDMHFDAITMNHVIEHVPNPIELLKECLRVLKPGGKMMVATPNIKSLGHHIFGQDWRGLEVPRHITLFSPQALRSCSERVGLNVEDVRTASWSAPWMWAASSFIRRDGILPGGLPKDLSLWMRLKGMAFRIREHGIRGPRESGEVLIMMARR